MTTVAKFDSPEEAYLFLAFLDSREIAGAVLDEHVAQWFWTYRLATGGVRVVVYDDADQEEAVAARREYSAAINADPAVLGEVRYWPLVLLLTLLAGVPLPLWGRVPVVAKRRASQ